MKNVDEDETRKEKFIVIEGGIGAGKSTCIEYLKRKLKDKDNVHLYNTFKQFTTTKDVIEPDIIIFLDVVPEIGMRRKHKKIDCEEKLEFHQRARNRLLKQYDDRRRYKSKWRYIDTTNMTEKSVKKAVWDIVSKVLGS